MKTRTSHLVSLAAALLALELSACRGPQPKPEDRFVVLGCDDTGDYVWRIDLATGHAARDPEFEQVDDPAQLHGALAKLGARIVDADGHALDIATSVFELSPDQRMLAAGCEDGMVCVARLGEPLEAVAAGSLLAWARDSRSLLVTHVEQSEQSEQSERHQLELLGLGETKARPLAEVEFTPGGAIEMPDGSWWFRPGIFGDALWRVDPDSGAALLVHERPDKHLVLSRPIPSGDGEHVVFISDADNECLAGDIWIVGFDGVEPRRITSSRCSYLSPNRGIDPNWFAPLPDGRFVAMVSGKDECEPSLGTTSLRCSSELYVLEPVTGQMRRVTDLDFFTGTKGQMTVLPQL